MTSRRIRPRGTVSESRVVSRDAPESAGDLHRGAGIARHSDIWGWISSFVPLLPVLGAYMLVSVAIHAAPNDENIYLAYTRNLTHVFSGQTYGQTDFLLKRPALPGLLAPLVALDVPLQVTRILVGPVLLFMAMVVFNRLVRLYPTY